MPADAPNVHDPRVPTQYRTWPGVHAGFHADLPAHLPSGGSGDPDAPAAGLLHAGETWAGTGYAIDRHEHPVWELYLQAHGTTRWEAGGRLLLVPAGTAFAVPPGTSHRLAERPGTRHHFFYAALDPEAFAPSIWPATAVTFLPDAGPLSAPFRALIRELTAVRPWQSLGLRTAATQLVLEAARLAVADVDGVSPPLPRPTAPAVVRARRLLDERFAERWRVADLAAGSGISATHLAELFTRDVGVPPHRYLLERRLARAAELLAGSDLPITAIALDVGFGSGPHLARAFRAATGCSPREHRRRARTDRADRARAG